MGVALVLFAPWQGWWTLVLLAVVGLNLVTRDARMPRSSFPEVQAVASRLLILLVIGAGITTLVLVAATVPVAPAAVIDDPSPLIAPLALLACVTAVTSVLMSAEMVPRKSSSSSCSRGPEMGDAIDVAERVRRAAAAACPAEVEPTLSAGRRLERRLRRRPRRAVQSRRCRAARGRSATDAIACGRRRPYPARERRGRAPSPDGDAARVS